jgi:Cysteine-rich secretory protein family
MEERTRIPRNAKIVAHIRADPRKMKILFAKSWWLAVAACLLACVPRGAPAQQPSAAEKYLFNAVNVERGERGLQPLRWDAALAEAAQRHTLLMAREKTLSHQLPGEPALQERASQAGAHFSQIGENIGEAMGVPDLDYGWMHSPPHRANILKPEYTSIGIAVRRSGKVYFATQDFSVAAAELSFREQEEKIGKLIEARRLRVALGTEDARQACRSNGPFRSQVSGAIVHFETADLTRLPADLEKMVARGEYRSAEVGACQPSGAGGFTRYRLAVLLH